MRKKLLEALILSVIVFVAIPFWNEGRGEEGEQMLPSFSVKKLQDVYLSDEKMPVEIMVKNNTRSDIWLCMPSVGRERSYFVLRLSEADLKNISDEKIRIRSTHPIIAAVSPDAKDVIMLKTEEEYKDTINVAELVNYLGLKAGAYNIRLVYTMWILILGEKPEYLKNREGEMRRWQSNEIQIKIGDRGLQDFLKEHPKADTNRDGILTEEEKKDYEG